MLEAAQAQFCGDHQPSSPVHIQSQVQSALGGANESSTVVVSAGGTVKLTNSNEKLEARYKEIIKENDGKLFEVHQKKGQAGLVLPASLD